MTKKKTPTLQYLHKPPIWLVVSIVGIIALVGIYIVYSSLASSRTSIKLTKIDPGSGTIGTKVVLYSDKQFVGQYKININSINSAMSATSTDGGKTLSFIFSATPCSIGKSCAQVIAKPGNYKISITDKLNQSSNALTFKLVQDKNSAYFEVGGARPEDTHIIQLNKTEDIAHARDLAANKLTDRPKIMGIISKIPVSYNPKWSFHLEPSTISFFDVAAEVCDSGTSYVEEHLSEVGGAFLPDNRWCPWNSYIVREVK